MAIVDIRGLSKPAVLAALCNATSSLGMGRLEDKGPVSEKDAEAVLERSSYVDYCCGRPIKADFAGDQFESWGYDRDAGQGAAERVVEKLRRA